LARQRLECEELALAFGAKFLECVRMRPPVQPAIENLQVRRAGGIALVECLVYVSVLFVVLGVAYSAFDRFQDSSRDLKRNTTDIARALQAGERWRADVRAATGPVRLADANNGQFLRIPHTNGEVLYEFSQGSVWRQAGATAPRTKVLPQVKMSRMQADQRQQVKSLRWELELPSRRQVARVRPLFTFQAVVNPQRGQ